MTVPERAAIESALAGFPRTQVPLEGRKAAAVAVPVVMGQDGPAILVTRRASKLRAHSGQKALPGGKIDSGETAVQAALRELDEELGLLLAPESVLGLLDDYPTRSGYVMTPVVVWAGADPALVPNPAEVAYVFRLGYQQLDTEPTFLTIPESEHPVIRMPIEGSWVHAPTAAVLYQFREVVLHGRHTRVAHLEQPVFAWK